MRIETSNPADAGPAMTSEEFQNLGSSHIGYVRRVSAEFASGILNQDGEDQDTAGLGVPAARGGLDEFWALYGADGQLLAISDTRNDVLQLAVESELVPLPRH